MDASLRYLASDDECFAALVQRGSLAGLHFEPMPPLRVEDRYLDTERGALLEAGYSLRFRQQGGEARATLRTLAVGEGVSQPFEGEALHGGPVREAVEALVGAEPLVPLLTLRQYRLPRGVYDGRRLVGVISLDVVTDESGEVPESWHEVEVERTLQGAAEDLRRLDVELRELGLEPVERSKFERALVRLGRGGDGPLYLLPEERAALEAFRRSESSVERRRAEALLLAAEGLPTRTISFKAGLSPSRVRHWKHAFRYERLGVFSMDEDSGDEPALEAAEEPLGFRISELVEAPAEPGRHRRSADTEIADVFEAVLTVAHRHPGTPRLGGDAPADRHAD